MGASGRKACFLPGPPSKYTLALHIRRARSRIIGHMVPDEVSCIYLYPRLTNSIEYYSVDIWLKETCPALFNRNTPSFPHTQLSRIFAHDRITTPAAQSQAPVVPSV